MTSNIRPIRRKVGQKLNPWEQTEPGIEPKDSGPTPQKSQKSNTGCCLQRASYNTTPSAARDFASGTAPYRLEKTPAEVTSNLTSVS